MINFNNSPLKEGERVITTSAINTRRGAYLAKGSRGVIRKVMPLGFIIEAEGKLWWVAPMEIIKR